MKDAQVRTSKFLSLVLRHKPEKAGLTLDESGWCSVRDLLSGCASQGYEISRDFLDKLVSDNEKQRFQFSDDGNKIRAVQGHSVVVDLKYQPTNPPEILYHGTATRFIDSIKKVGLVRGSRQHVHLSPARDTAFNVGARHGLPVVIPVSAQTMQDDGFVFYHTPNNVWLTNEVPPQYLMFQDLLYNR